jgi:type IV pilus assembly protein PilN
MTRINLLPWRETRRKEQQRQFFSIAAGAVILMGMTLLYVHLHMSSLIEGQEQRNRFLQDEIAKVEEKIAEIRALETKKQQLLARMDIIQQLQTRRPEIIHIFDELVRAVPSGMYLTGITQTGQVIVIEGSAQSNARISTLMRNLDGSDWFNDPKLDVIEADSRETARVSKFKLTVRQARLGADGDAMNSERI